MKDPVKEEMKRRERQEEKERAMRELTSYNPWGRPGGGAPGQNTRRQGFTDDTSPWTDNPRADTPEDNLYVQFGKPGAGAPLRTASGKVRTGYQSDAAIRFQVNGQSNNLIDKEVRYKRGGADKQEYSQELQQQMASKAMSDKEARLKELRKEMEMMNYDPYGKPGAGAPNTNRNKKTSHFPPINNESNSRNNSSKINRFRREETFEFYDPWGKGVGKAPELDKAGRIKRNNRYEKPENNHRENKENGRLKREDKKLLGDARNDSPMSVNSGSLTGEKPFRGEFNNLPEDVRPKRPFQDGRDNSYDPFGKPIWGAPNRHQEPQYKGRKRGDDFHGDNVGTFDPFGKIGEPTGGQNSRSKRNFAEPVEIYDPFGKGGAGAPLKDQNGRLKTNIFGNLKDRTSADQRRREQAQKYRDEIQKEIQEQTRKRKERDSMLKHGGGTLQISGLVPKQQQTVGTPANENEASDLPRTRGSDRRSPDIKRGREDRMARTDEHGLYNTDIEKAAHERRKHYNPAESFHPGRGTGSAFSGASFNLPDLEQSYNTRGRDSRDPPHAPRGEPRSYNGLGRELNSYGSDEPTKAHAGRTPRATHANNYEVPASPEFQHGHNYSIKQPWAGSIEI